MINYKLPKRKSLEDKNFVSLKLSLILICADIHPNLKRSCYASLTDEFIKKKVLIPGPWLFCGVTLSLLFREGYTSALEKSSCAPRARVEHLGVLTLKTRRQPFGFLLLLLTEFHVVRAGN